ncbi:sodium:solute symporter [Roseateles aquatilis]|uniref:Sodium:solute symporter n=1 Tax=Roseateles aquatilis TaxID=431061 RepID=A0A246JDY3_9BURK|nr:sodium/solute symporter [Roseateles aquatilis]OWQ90808.1 sodium:solute symporter [Roseateles aquatilis]
MTLLLAALRHLLILTCCLAGLARADSLASVRGGGAPPLPGAAPIDALLTIAGQPVAIAGDQAWTLVDGKTWSASPWTADAPLLATAGGGDAAFALRGGARVDQLRLRQGGLVATSLAPLPLALRNARVATLGASVFVAGRDAQGQARLYEMKAPDATMPWQERPAWTGVGEPSALVGQTGALFLALDNGHWLRWSADKGWAERGTLPGALTPGALRAIGQAHLLMLSTAPGAATQLMTFHTITGSWATLPAPTIAGARLGTSWGDGLLWLPPGQGQAFVGAEVEAGKQLLKWLDWVVIVVYLVAMLGMGAYFYLREKRNSTSDFFVGGRSIPFWAAGISLYAANTSSISYIAIPAKAFESNWQYMTNNLVAVVGLMFVAVWIVPLLRRLDLMSVFHYLEIRFHPVIRMLASALCIAVQIGSRMSVVLFLPALAIATITGLDVVWSILIMGGFTIVYTAMGGMKAVVWTDFVQLFVKMGGAIFAIGFIVYQLNGGFGEFMQVAAAESKTKLFDFSFDLTKATVWGFIFLVLFDVVLTFPKDQVLMQRVLSTKSDKEAGRSIWAFAAIMIPGGFVFYGIGTALFVYYKANPERMNPLLPIDATFPLFIAAELPMGITGLIIAGIFAAAMATLSSIMNSVATLASVDFYEKLARNPTPKNSVRFAEVMTVVAGLLGIATALLLSRFDIHSLFDVSIELAGLLGGGFAGAYTLGMFTRRANSGGVAIGVASSIVLTSIAWSMKLVHPYFYLAISIMLCIVIGYLASLLFPAPTRSLKGLTIYKDV